MATQVQSPNLRKRKPPRKKIASNVIDVKKKKRESMDYFFLLIVLLLLTIGLVSLFSASFAHAHFYYGDSYKFIYKQFIFAIMGVVIMLVIAQFNYNMLNNPTIVWLLYVITIVLLISVFFFEKLNNSRRWIHIGDFITFQPSEIAKFTVAVMFSHLIALNYKKMNNFKKSILPLICLLAPIVLLLVKEPHISATIIVLMIAAILLFVGGVDMKWFLLLGIVAVLGFILIVNSGAISYLGPRIEIWKDPWSDPRGDGYQTIQSLYAIGSGGVVGQGIGGSIQKYLYLPELQNDYVFAIVCEEVGFIGATLIIILFALLVWRGFVIGMRCKDRFGALLAIGITTQVGIQVIFNILVVTNTIPVTGISLPFFSSGGTSLLMLLAQMGVLLSISRYPADQTTYIEKEVVIEEELD